MKSLINLARSLLGEDIASHENLPELLCRPCERKLENYRKFMLKIKEYETEFSRLSERCVEVSPSLIPLAVKLHETNRFCKSSNTPHSGVQRDAANDVTLLWK